MSWTPTIIVSDRDGREQYRFTGFLPPAEMCARLLLESGKVEMNARNFELAQQRLSQVIHDYPGSYALPEAIFYSGVVGYQSSQKPQKLRETFERLKKELPHSEWTLKAEPFAAIRD